jgi:hypothetical protein
LKPLLVGLLLAAFVAGAEDPQPMITVRRPTVIGFIGPVTDKDVEKSPDINEALADFRYYSKRWTDTLEEMGIVFEVVSVKLFRVHVGAKITTFRSGKVKWGYYFVAPRKKPRVVYGVDSGLGETASEYFRIKLPEPN